MRTKEQITEVEVYWDTQGPTEAWVERITYDDNHQESGPCEWIEADDSIDMLPDAVVQAAYGYGLDIDSDAVAVEHIEGGHGLWAKYPR